MSQSAREDASGAGAAPGNLPTSTTTESSPGVDSGAAKSQAGVAGAYRVQGEVGRGGVGIVLEAYDHRLARTVALKQLQRVDVRARERFDREMRITARLQHPGVVPVHEAGLTPTGQPFYAMRLVEGTSLRDLFRQAPELAERLKYLANVLTVAETIAYAHSQRVIHRDLKPANIIVGAFGETVVIDWGLAKELDDHEPADDAPELETGGPYRLDAGQDAMTLPGQVIGTPAYMPPEQARGEATDERSDIYAIGAILYTLLSGETPFAGKSSAEIVRTLSSATSLVFGHKLAGAPPELVAITKKCLAARPADRYPTALELAADLRAFLSGHGVSAYAYSVRDRVGRWIARHREASLITVAALALLSVGMVLALVFIARERDGARSSAAQAQRASELATKKNAELLLEQAASEVDRGDIFAAFARLRDHLASGYPSPNATNVLAHALLLGVPTFSLSTDGLLAFDLSPDGTQLATVTNEEFRLYDATNGARLATHSLRDLHGVFKVTFTATSLGPRWLVLAEQKALTLAIDKGQVTRQELALCPGGYSTASDLEGDRSYIGCVDGRLLELDHVHGNVALIGRPPGPPAAIRHLPDRTLVASRSGGLNVLEHRSGRVRGLASTGELLLAGGLSGDCDTAAIGTKDGRLLVVDSNDRVRTLKLSQVALTYVKVGRGCRLVGALDEVGNAYLLDLQTAVVHRERGRELALHNALAFLQDEAGRGVVIDYDTGWRASLRLGSAAAQQLSLSSGGTVAAWTPKRLVVFPPQLPSRVVALGSAQYTMATSQDERHVLIGSREGHLQRIDASDAIRLASPHHGLVMVRPLRGGGFASLGLEDGCLATWDQLSPNPTRVSCDGSQARDFAVTENRIFLLTATGQVRAIALPALELIAGTHIAQGTAHRIVFDSRSRTLLISTQESIVNRLNEDLSALPSKRLGIASRGIYPLGQENFLAITRQGAAELLDRNFSVVASLGDCRGTVLRTWLAPDYTRFVGACQTGSTIPQDTRNPFRTLTLSGSVTDIDISDSTTIAISQGGSALLVDEATQTMTAYATSFPLGNSELARNGGFAVLALDSMPMAAVEKLPSPRRRFPMQANSLKVDLSQYLERTSQ